MAKDAVAFYLNDLFKDKELLDAANKIVETSTKNMFGLTFTQKKRVSSLIKKGNIEKKPESNEVSDHIYKQVKSFHEKCYEYYFEYLVHKLYTAFVFAQRNQSKNDSGKTAPRKKFVDEAQKFINFYEKYGADKEDEFWKEIKSAMGSIGSDVPFSPSLYSLANTKYLKKAMHINYNFKRDYTEEMTRQEFLKKQLNEQFNVLEEVANKKEENKVTARGPDDLCFSPSLMFAVLILLIILVLIVMLIPDFGRSGCDNFEGGIGSSKMAARGYYQGNFKSDNEGADDCGC